MATGSVLDDLRTVWRQIRVVPRKLNLAEETVIRQEYDRVAEEMAQWKLPELPPPLTIDLGVPDCLPLDLRVPVASTSALDARCDTPSLMIDEGRDETVVEAVVAEETDSLPPGQPGPPLLSVPEARLDEVRMSGSEMVVVTDSPRSPTPERMAAEAIVLLAAPSRSQTRYRQVARRSRRYHPSLGGRKLVAGKSPAVGTAPPYLGTTSALTVGDAEGELLNSSISLVDVKTPVRPPELFAGPSRSRRKIVFRVPRKLFDRGLKNIMIQMDD